MTYPTYPTPSTYGLPPYKPGTPDNPYAAYGITLGPEWAPYAENLGPLLGLYAPQIQAANTLAEQANLYAQRSAGQRTQLGQLDLAQTRNRIQAQLARLGLRGQEIGVQQQLANQLLGLANQGLDIDFRAFLNRGQAIGLEREMRERAAWRDATARGATVTEGFRQDLAQIAQEAENRMGANRIQAERDRLAYEQTVARLKADQASLDLAAKGLGIDRNELTNSLALAEQIWGVNAQMIQDQLAQAVQQNDYERINAIGNALNAAMQQAMQLGLLRPTQPKYNISPAGAAKYVGRLSS
jgi:hypothetical protein